MTTQIGRKLIPDHPFVKAAKESYKGSPMTLGFREPDFIYEQGFLAGIRHLQKILRENEAPTLALQNENDIACL